MATNWLDLALYVVTLFTIFIQAYMIWLIVYRTPKKMIAFRFSLFMLMQNEICLTFAIGFVLDPNLLFPYIQGAIVNGLARFLGPDGGRYGFALCLFFGAGVFCNQIYCLLYRYTAIQQGMPMLNKQFNRWTWRTCLCCLGYLLTTCCGIAAFFSMADMEETQQIVQPYVQVGLLPQMANGTVFVVLSGGNGMKIFGIFIMGGYSLASVLSIGFSLLIYNTIRANASHFTARTYKLHLQLTALLIVQFCLPMLFLILPVAYAIISVVFLVPISKIAGDLSILLLSLYTLANSMATLAFVGPYRDFTLRLLRLKKEPIKLTPLQIQQTVNKCSQVGQMNAIFDQSVAQIHPVMIGEPS